MNRLLIGTLLFFLTDLLGLKWILNKSWLTAILMSTGTSILWYFGMKFFMNRWQKKPD